MPVRQQVACPRHLDHGLEQLAHHVMRQQAIPVPAEGFVPPDVVVHRQAHTPAVQYVVAHLHRRLSFLQDWRRALLSEPLNRLIDEGRASGAARLAGAPATLERTGDPVFCTIWTLVSVPALTLPVGLGPLGLPPGLQIVGTPEGDARLLHVARWIEQAVAFATGIPER
jgi:hypothetical protein